MGIVVRTSARAAFVVAVVAGLVGAVLADEAQKPKKLKRPNFELRVSPRFSFSPAELVFTAELTGGDDTEEYYCPEIEWEWGDGGKSVQEADCDPWTATTPIQRRFTANHTYQFAGLYRVKITLRKSNKDLMSQTVAITIRAGLGDQSPEPGD